MPNQAVNVIQLLLFFAGKQDSGISWHLGAAGALAYTENNGCGHLIDVFYVTNSVCMETAQTNQRFQNLPGTPDISHIFLQVFNSQHSTFTGGLVQLRP